MHKGETLRLHKETKDLQRGKRRNCESWVGEGGWMEPKSVGYTYFQLIGVEEEKRKN